jgi:uncharacterized protein (DUF488 family)
MKEEDNQSAIWTIGHSTHSLEEFISWLNAFEIQEVVDVRSYPGSRKYPQFNKQTLEVSLPQAGLNYVHLKALGGRRKAAQDSVNTAWHHPSFRGYADYMETTGFKTGIAQLEQIAKTNRTAIMCSEVLWWRCHRSMIADYLKVCGWTVIHIMGPGKGVTHPYTAPARIHDHALSYQNGRLLREP